MIRGLCAAGDTFGGDRRFMGVTHLLRLLLVVALSTGAFASSASAAAPSPADAPGVIAPVVAEPGAAPVDAAPVDAAPVDAAPVDAAPVDAAPASAEPVAGPAVAAPVVAPAAAPTLDVAPARWPTPVLAVLALGVAAVVGVGAPVAGVYVLSQSPHVVVGAIAVAAILIGPIVAPLAAGAAVWPGGGFELAGSTALLGWTVGSVVAVVGAVALPIVFFTTLGGQQGPDPITNMALTIVTGIGLVAAGALGGLAVGGVIGATAGPFAAAAIEGDKNAE